MNTHGKTITRTVATYGVEHRDVLINTVENGMVEIRALEFEPFMDNPVWYHGFWTSPENIHNVKVFYSDGSHDFLGEPPVNVIHVPSMAHSEVAA